MTVSNLRRIGAAPGSRQISLIISIVWRPKKVSGRWGFRPLGRGDGGKRNPKLFLTSRHYAALASSTTAHRSSVDCPGSRDQLPITIVIVLPGQMSVDSSLVLCPPVLPGPCFRTVPQVLSYRLTEQDAQ